MLFASIDSDTGVGPNIEDIAELLGEIADPAAVPSLQRGISNGPDWDEYQQFARKCIWALSKIGTPEALGAIRMAIDSEDPHTRAYAEDELERRSRSESESGTDRGQRHAPANNCIANPAAQGAGRLQSATIAGTPTSWSYDGGGNLQQVTANGTASTTYQYAPDAPDELQSVSVAGSPAVVTYGGYDANGNPGSITTTGLITTDTYLSYDNAGRLSAFSRGDGGTGVFSYNAQGQRTAFTWNLPGSGNTPSYTLGYQYRDGQLAQLSVSTPVPT